METKGRRSLVKQKGCRAVAEGQEVCSQTRATRDQGGAGGTREPGRARGLMDHGGVENAQSWGGADRLTPEEMVDPGDWTEPAKRTGTMKGL